MKKDIFKDKFLPDRNVRFYIIPVSLSLINIILICIRFFGLGERLDSLGGVAKWVLGIPYVIFCITYYGVLLGLYMIPFLVIGGNGMPFGIIIIISVLIVYTLMVLVYFEPNNKKEWILGFILYFIYFLLSGAMIFFLIIDVLTNVLEGGI